MFCLQKGNCYQFYVGYAIKPRASKTGACVDCRVGISCFWWRLTEETKLRFFMEESSCLQITHVSVADLLQQISERLWLFSKRDRQEVNH